MNGRARANLNPWAGEVPPTPVEPPPPPPGPPVLDPEPLPPAPGPRETWERRLDATELPMPAERPLPQEQS